MKRPLWMDFLSDLSFLLPAFGTVFGLLFLLGQSPFLGAGMVTICPIILALRIHVAFQAHRERRRVKELISWYRQHRVDYGSYRINYGRPKKQMVDDVTEVVYYPIPPANHAG